MKLKLITIAIMLSSCTLTSRTYFKPQVFYRATVTGGEKKRGYYERYFKNEFGVVDTIRTRQYQRFVAGDKYVMYVDTMRGQCKAQRMN